MKMRIFWQKHFRTIKMMRKCECIAFRTWNTYTSNEGIGFFPGHASFAYFFFFGSRGLLDSTSIGNPTVGAVFTRTGGATGRGSTSTSGAKLGILSPSFAAMLKEDPTAALGSWLSSYRPWGPCR